MQILETYVSDGAGAVGNGKGARLGDGVRLVVHVDVGGLRAVRRVNVDDLGDGLGAVVLGVSGGNGASESKDDGLREHIEG